MLLQTWNRTFFIMNQLYNGFSQECFVGMEIIEGKEKEYNIIRIKGQEVAKQFLKVYTENNKGCNEMEFLVIDDVIYAVFPYKRERSFEGELKKESYTLKERLTIGKNILEKIIFSDVYDTLLPYYLQWDGLVNDSIQISESFEITFLHKLNNIECFEQYNISDVYDALEKIFRMLFRHEIDREVSEIITDFIHSFKEENNDNYLSLYARYRKVFDECDIENIDKAEPRNLPFRVWSKTKSLLSFSKKIGIVIILVIALGYTMMSMFGSKQEVKKVDDEYRFLFIGNVQIK